MFRDFNAVMQCNTMQYNTMQCNTIQYHYAVNLSSFIQGSPIQSNGFSPAGALLKAMMIASAVPMYGRIGGTGASLQNSALLVGFGRLQLVLFWCGVVWCGVLWCVVFCCIHHMCRIV